MTYFDAAFWSRHFREVFVPYIRAFERAAIERLLPAFDGIEGEAERVSDEEYRRLGQLPGDDSVDMADLAERAQEAGLAHYQELVSVRQSLLNLSATALFHLSEQQLLLFHRRQVLGMHEEFQDELFSKTKILARLKTGGVDLETFQSWRGIQELEALANTVKHGRGRSSKRLVKLRPDLLVYPPLRSESRYRTRVSGEVHLPLAGDSVYVTESDFRQFAQYVVEFWIELADAIQSAQRTDQSRAV